MMFINLKEPVGQLDDKRFPPALAMWTKIYNERKIRARLARNRRRTVQNQRVPSERGKHSEVT
jgi:hypothetical protein